MSDLLKTHCWFSHEGAHSVNIIILSVLQKNLVDIVGMDTADPQNRSEWRGHLKVQPSVEDNRL